MKAAGIKALFAPVKWAPSRIAKRSKLMPVMPVMPVMTDMRGLLPMSPANGSRP